MIMSNSPMSGALRAGKAASDVALAMMPWMPATGPHAANDVTTDFLGQVFAAAAPGAAARSTSDIGGNTGTTDRRRITVEWNDIGQAAGLPSTLFVKSTPLTAKNRTMVAALDMAVNEVKFYKTARASLADASAPVAHYARAGRGARHLIIMNDLVAEGGRAYALSEECDLAHAQGIMIALADLHAAFWDSPRFATDLTYAVRQFDRPGFGLLRRQFRHVRSKMISQREPSAAVLDMIDVVNRNDRRLYERWTQGPLTLIHGDTHLGNTFQTADGHSGFLDWQVVGQAPGLREVSYFLTHSLPTELRRTHQDDLIRLYLSALGERGVNETLPTFGEAWAAIRHFAFDAWDSSAICVVWPGLQTPANTEAGIARANATVEDFEVADELRRFLG